VEAFLNRRISFLHIADVVDEVLTMHRPLARPSIEDIIETDEWARRTARSVVEQISERRTPVFAKAVMPTMSFVQRQAKS
jgi:1-deoxy-D-xylulose 5-phosphate reductoisomerase